MGQFKPMVKMETTEPSVVLKLKKGGHVDMKKGAKAEEGHKPMHKFDGGAMGVRGLPMVGGSAAPLSAMSPKRPSPAEMRKKMMMAQMMKQKMAAPQMAAAPMAAPMMKEGGKADMAQDKSMIKKAMSQHDAQEHKGGKGTKLSLKSGGSTGGVKNGNAGGYKTGGVVNGQGGYKTGGVVKGNAGGYKKGGMMDGGMMDGGMNRGMMDGYKKGGAAKKAYATGGLVNSGKPVAMPEGHKKPTPPVVTNQVSGTFKKGGTVQRKNKGGDLEADKETKGYNDFYANQKADNLADREAMNPMTYIRPLVKKVKGMFGSADAPGAVTKTKESTTIVPKKQRKGGEINC